MQSAIVLIGIIIAVGVLYVLVPVAFSAYRRACCRAMIRCPETGESAALRLDAGHAAWTATFGNPKLRVDDCSLWPGRKDCEQRCLGALEPAGR
jgi:hypothetical protein